MGLGTSFIALLVSAISLATQRFKFAQQADAHRITASLLWDVRESYLSLIADLMAGATSESDARGRRDALQVEAREVYSEAPRTTSKAFLKAGRGLKANQEMTFTTQEIDRFLPELLRLQDCEERA